MSNLSDIDPGPGGNFLLERLKEGDREVFTLLFKYYYSGLVVYADRNIRNMELSEDIVQSVFVKLWENKHSLKSESIRFFLLNSVKNSCIDLSRKKETQEKYTQRQISQDSDYGDDFWAENELKEMIETAIGKLPPKCREIFKLSRYEGLKSDEIARKLQISQRTVETQITKALKILRNDLKDYLFQLFFIF